MSVRRVEPSIANGGMVKAGPDLAPPPRVIAFDHGLESELTRRNEDGHHGKAQTQSNHAAQRNRRVVCPLEDRVVVELGVGGQPGGAPVLGQICNGAACAHRPGDWPGIGQATVQGNAIEYLGRAAVTRGQAFDQVKAVKLAAASG